MGALFFVDGGMSHVTNMAKSASTEPKRNGGPGNKCFKHSTHKNIIDGGNFSNGCVKLKASFIKLVNLNRKNFLFGFKVFYEILQMIMNLIYYQFDNFIGFKDKHPGSMKSKVLYFSLKSERKEHMIDPNSSLYKQINETQHTKIDWGQIEILEPLI
jgi:hypothetical protein